MTDYTPEAIEADVAHMRRDKLLPGDYGLHEKDGEAMLRLLSLAERVAKASVRVAWDSRGEAFITAQFPATQIGVPYALVPLTGDSP